MRRHARTEPTPLAHPLDHARHKCRAVELAHLFRNADVLVDEGLVVANHVFVIVRGGVLDGVGGAAEEVAPEGGVDELEKGEDAGGAGREGGGAVEEEGEDAEAEGDADGGEADIDALVSDFCIAMEWIGWCSWILVGRVGVKGIPPF